MRIDILTLFPDMFTGVFGNSILKRAVDKKLLEFTHTTSGVTLPTSTTRPMTTLLAAVRAWS